MIEYRCLGRRRIIMSTICYETRGTNRPSIALIANAKSCDFVRSVKVEVAEIIQEGAIYASDEFSGLGWMVFVRITR